jgi:1-acyl-sn-glycerol-3-phosphate acyltransferase
VPVALNTGVFWPKNKIMKYPGTVIVRFLPPIEPGMEKRAFLNKLQNEIEKEQETLQSEWNQ